MKKMTSFLRFVLVMVGSFLLTIGTLIANGCRSLSGSPRNGARQSKRRSTTRPRRRLTTRPSSRPATRPTTRPTTGPATRPTSRPAGLAQRSVDELIKMLDSDDYKERQAAQKDLTARGQKVVPKLKAALKSDSLEVVSRAKEILSVLGWYVTRKGKVEKMSESKEFQEMMRKRLPEMPAE